MATLGLIDRLRQWAELQKISPVEEIPGVTGGRDGELLLRQSIATSPRLRRAHVFAGRRIPSKRQGRRREIDLIVCTPAQILLIEVKNWSGQLSIVNGDWRQTRRSGETVNHGNLIRENKLRQEAVASYLLEHGLSVDESFVQKHLVPIIVFTNPNLVLDPEVEAIPEVVSPRSLHDFLGTQPKGGLVNRILSSIFDRLKDFLPEFARGIGQASKDRIPSRIYEKIVSYLEETESWDQLILYGTKVISGDLLSVTIGPKTYRKSEVADLSGCAEIQLRWTRGRFWGLLKALTGLGALGWIKLGPNWIRLITTDRVRFHPVGNPEPGEVEITRLDLIRLGAEDQD
jgi:hypothetical protein